MTHVHFSGASVASGSGALKGVGGLARNSTGQLDGLAAAIARTGAVISKFTPAGPDGMCVLALLTLVVRNGALIVLPAHHVREAAAAGRGAGQERVGGISRRLEPRPEQPTGVIGRISLRRGGHVGRGLCGDRLQLDRGSAGAVQGAPHHLGPHHAAARSVSAAHGRRGLHRRGGVSRLVERRRGRVSGDGVRRGPAAQQQRGLRAGALADEQPVGAGIVAERHTVRVRGGSSRSRSSERTPTATTRASDNRFAQLERAIQDIATGSPAGVVPAGPCADTLTSPCGILEHGVTLPFVNILDAPFHDPPRPLLRLDCTDPEEAERALSAAATFDLWFGYEAFEGPLTDAQTADPSSRMRAFPRRSFGRPPIV